jgi:hypothetical protein
MSNFFKDNANYVYISNFDINKIRVIKDKSDDKGNTFLVEYNEKPFYLINNKAFETLGFKDYEIFGEDNNITKLTITLDDNNEFHNKFKKTICEIYDKVNMGLRNRYKTIEVIHPLGDKKRNTIDLEIYEYKYASSSFHEYRDTNTKYISPNILKNTGKNAPFVISPIIFLSKLYNKNNKVFLNFRIKEAYIQFIRPLLDFNDIQYMFQKKTTNGINNENINKDDDIII